MTLHVLAAAVVLCAPAPPARLPPSAAPAREEAKALIDRTVADFGAIAAEGWQDWRLCELHSKGEDKRAFLNRSFGRSVVPAGAAVDWKEVQASEEPESSALHLGVAAVTYPDAVAASAAHAQIAAVAPPFLKGTKILTEFRALLRGSTLLVAYSETGSHPKLQRFFASLGAAR